MSNFAHLHLHTQYSMLDGANKPAEVISRAKELGQTSIAITDHGNMHGAIEFYKLAHEQGIKPIIGCEVYITNGSRFEKSSKTQNGAHYFHLTMLAMNFAGYQNLCKLVTSAYLEGFYFKPRIDHELLGRFNSGIICLSGCVSGEFGAFARAGDYDNALAIAKQYEAIFGDRYYLEVQPHKMKDQEVLNQVARDVGKTLGLPLVATNDCHYLRKDDHFAQEVLMAIGTGKQISDPDRIFHDGLELYLKSESEMLDSMPEFAEAVHLSDEIAKRCDLELDFSTYHMPSFEPSNNLTLEEEFVASAKRGLEERLSHYRKSGYAADEAAYQKQLDEEIQIILNMGFGGYFLVVSDFISWAKDQNIPVGPGRGSAAGSLVAYVMRITEIDPIRYSLLFERFLNPERVSLPDIDVDFCITGRDKVIKYVTEKYGKDKVSQIVTFGTLKAKAAIKDVGRALGVSYGETDRIAKLVPAPRQGFDYPLEKALEMEERLREYAAGEGKELMGLAMKLEGLSRHSSTHAAGVVISDKPIVDYMPMMVDKDDQVVSQYSMSYVEKIGLVKFDFLGLKTLSVIHEAERLIMETTGVRLDINDLPLEDEKPYKMISAGKTIGVFQLESSGITDMVCRLKPNCFEDIVAILALYRPGPLDAGMVDHYINRKHKREKTEYPHPSLEGILKDTYGIILYQEQIMQIARDMGNYTLGEADLLRRAMGKKKPEEMAKQRQRFLDGAKSLGVPDKISGEVFDQMETFARYGFNRSHSVAYAMISYQTAYLKAHFPRQFMAALMTFEKSDTDKTLKNLTECKEMGIKVLSPDVNRAGIGFFVEDNNIIFDLSALKGIGDKVIERVIEERNKNGVFKGLTDFCRRVDPTILNKRTMESLIYSGAFDWTKLPRAELMERHTEIIKLVLAENAQKNSAQISLFAPLEAAVADTEYEPARPLKKEWPTSEKLSYEKSALGFYLSGHPLEQYADDLKVIGADKTDRVLSAKDGEVVQVAGVVTFLKEKNTKKGDRYATFILEDICGTVETVVWPDVYKSNSEIFGGDAPIVVKGKVDVSEERRVLIANEISSLTNLRNEKVKQVVLKLQSTKCDKHTINELKSMLHHYPGACTVKLLIEFDGKDEAFVSLPEKFRIAPSEELRNKLEGLFGRQTMQCQ